MLETLQKVLRLIHLYCGAEESVPPLNTLRKFDGAVLLLSLFSADWSAFFGIILNLQCSYVPEQWVEILHADENLSKKVVKVFESKAVPVSVFYKAGSILGKSNCDLMKINRSPFEGLEPCCQKCQCWAEFYE